MPGSLQHKLGEQQEMYKAQYEVQATNATAGFAATDAEWSTVGASPAAGGAGGTEVVVLAPNTSARFFRVHCLERFAGSQWGFSLFEFQLYAPAAPEAP